jgi:hypothetical protein
MESEEFSVNQLFEGGSLLDVCTRSWDKTIQPTVVYILHCISIKIRLVYLSKMLPSFY